MRKRLDSVGFSTSTPDTSPAIYKCFTILADTGIEGDYYEFGLWQGYSFCVAQAAASSAGGTAPQFFGFDSFEGLPPLTGPDAGSHEFKAGDYAGSYEEVVSNLNHFGVDWERTHLVKGWYDALPESAAHLATKMGPAALVLVDCDLYESTVPVLRFVRDRLQPGTIVMFDDWNCFDRSDDMGQRRAFREFLDQNPAWKAAPLLSFGWHGQAFTMQPVTSHQEDRLRSPV
ncbi:MAG TPA: TylF/MycF/NovP-related O-methyltransferase [Acidimicrobiales bacterium]|nr:TylF/MycF/NovP-related O-methyltransferase [Acidimicrobiales bacterium]